MNRKLTQEEFLERSIKTHGNKYSYEKSIYNGTREKVIIICPDHGEFVQEVLSHWKGNGCFACFCAKITYSAEDFLEKAKDKHGDSFDYSMSRYMDGKTKVEIICPTHGSFWQLPFNHLAGQGCGPCSTIRSHNMSRSTLEEFVKKSKAVHGDTYSYNKVVYENAHKKIVITCKKHGDFQMKPADHLRKKSGCSKCKASSGENKIRSFLNSIGAAFTEQHPFPDCKDQLPLKFDFNLGPLLIEFQGQQHYKPVPLFGGEVAFKSTQKRDQIKRDYCEKNGLTLLEIKYDDEKWKEKIENVLFVYLL